MGQSDGSRSPAELERMLADRERRITLLTDQLLGVLDQLTEVRREATARRATQQLLQAAQRRVRRTGMVALDLAAATASDRCVVCWQTVGGRTWSAEALAAIAAAAGSAEVVWVGPANAAPEPAGPLRVHASDLCRTVVEAWNEAMAVSETPWVWLLAPGTELAAAGPQDWAPADADPLAALAPRQAAGDDERMGLADGDGSLGFGNRGPVVAAGHDVAALAPEAFALRRAAFETVGPFDPHLRGVLAVVDWSLRAADAGYRIVAQPGLRASGPALPRDFDARDHPLLLVRHRRDHAARALAGHPVWRALQGPMLSEFTHSLLDRLGAPPAARDAIVPVLVDLARATP